MKEQAGLTTTDAELYRKLAEMAANGWPGVLATVIGAKHSTPRHAGSKMIVHADGSVTGSVGGGKAEAEVIREAQTVMGDGVCRTLQLDLRSRLGVCGGEMEVFLEPVIRSLPFVVIGAGHVGRAVVELGAALPLTFQVIDDRPGALAGLTDRPGVRSLECGPAELAAQLQVPARGGLLIVSRSHELDGDYLEAVFAAEREQGREFRFLGVLASRTKANKLRSRFAGDAALADRAARTQLPVGLDLAAETPAEIALSVLAEATAMLRDVEFLTDDRGEALGVRLHRRRGSGS